ncbi:MAG TPA: TfoX/Sxy family protein [Hyphomicrobiaceae bacterium]|jgi:TfoX/Sxy family transcriptional regulator of competence genes|nr:TfoX/Sxy family protein [Hyphomicrobiaceae bacterium]
MTAEDKLAADVRKALAGTGTLSEVKMFGGVGFMLDGNMVAAVSRRGLLLRVGKDRYAKALARRGARPTEMRGRPVQGYVSVDPSTLTDGALTTWLREAAAFVKTLPPKATGTKRERKGDGK